MKKATSLLLALFLMLGISEGVNAQVTIASDDGSLEPLVGQLSSTILQNSDRVTDHSLRRHELGCHSVILLPAREPLRPACGASHRHFLSIRVLTRLSIECHYESDCLIHFGRLASDTSVI